MVVYHTVVVLGAVFLWKEGMGVITDILPKAQPKANSY